MTTTLSTDVARWLPFGIPPGRVRLYCLPHAGGAASAFRGWLGRIPRVSVCAVQPPGREIRLRETPHERMESLVAELADVVLGTADGPYAVYGHSLGALVGFELLREIRRRGGPDPVHLFVSGCAAPHYRYDDGPRVGGMTDEQVVAMLRELGGTPEWLLSDPAVLSMIIPPFRADFAVKETYRYEPESPLDVPITVLASTDDPRASGASMVAWRDLTTRRFTTHTLVGGHFAVLEQAGLSQAYIAEALRPWA
ncbi:MAG TPA: thioesterase domain-containing protein [Micromonosporaceae bacterium]